MIKLNEKQDARLMKYAAVRRPKEQCWPWLGPMSGSGYGKFHVNRVDYVAHRVVYEMWWGCPVMAGRVLDHTCRNTACVNPYHLEMVTHQENVLRGIGPTAKNAGKTHCPQGHEYTPETTRLRRGRRVCRICRKAQSREYWKRVARKRVANA